MMSPATGLVLILVALTTVAWSSMALASSDLPTYYIEMKSIAESSDPTKDQKIEKIRGYFAKTADWQMVVHWMAKVDKDMAEKAALEQFRRADLTRQQKLTVSHVILQVFDPKDFGMEYAPYLLKAVLDGGEKEFSTPREDTISAVGEYVFIASSFGGLNSKHWETIKDKRVIPVLVKCLVAPDNVYPKNQRGLVIGTPGQATGRNVQRQQIPIALAKLNAGDAVDPLWKVVRDHHDKYLRTNAAYALAILGDEKKRNEVEGFLKSADQGKADRPMLFAFGRGLLDRGDRRGLEFVSLDMALQGSDAAAVLLAAKGSLQAVGTCSISGLESYYQSVLGDKRLRALLAFDAEQIPAPGFWVDPVTGQASDPQAALRRLSPGVALLARVLADGVVAHRLTGLTGDLRKIAEVTKSQEVRETLTTAANSLTKTASDPRPASGPQR